MANKLEKGMLVWMKDKKQKGKLITVKGDKAVVEVIVDYIVEDGKKKRVTELVETEVQNVVKYRERKKKVKNRKKDVLYFAKTHPEAKIPSKRFEDAGYDFYACFDEDEMVLTKHKPNLVPTGIATSMPPKYFLNLKHERGSTAKYGMSVLAGVVDSGFRGQIWINIVPTYKDVVISKTYDFPKVDGKVKPVELEDKIMYPYELAIAQATLELVPNVDVKEISYEKLEKIPSIRGKTQLGESGK
jgi:dUTP pyrophosphatase